MRAGVGILTYNRPDYFAKSMRGAMTHLSGIADVYVYNDGSDDRGYRSIYDRWKREAAHIEHAEANRGIAAGKNWLLRAMLGNGYTHLFLLEDDVVPQSPLAITGYSAAAEASGLHHLNFHAHGPRNASGPVRLQGDVTYWPNLVGAFSFYTRECLEAVGLLDENFRNAWEHVEHYCRIERAGMVSPFGEFPDATRSEAWLAEIPGSFERTTLQVADREAHIAKQMAYWMDTYEQQGLPVPVQPAPGLVEPYRRPSAKRRGLRLRRRG